MARFDLQKLRNVADEGIARYGLRGYARKLGLDVSTLRSLRDGRDMQISKLTQIVDSMDMALTLMPARAPGATPPQPRGGSKDMVRIPYHPIAVPQSATQMSPIALHVDWLMDRGWVASDLRCIVAPQSVAGAGAGSSHSDALCLIDCGTTWPTVHALWACIEDDVLILAHVGRPEPGMLLFASTTQDAAPRIVTGTDLDRIRPLGRVVWTGAQVGGPARSRTTEV